MLFVFNLIAHSIPLLLLTFTPTLIPPGPQLYKKSHSLALAFLIYLSLASTLPPQRPTFRLLPVLYMDLLMLLVNFVMLVI
jgi:hypothetical protein